jgi:hypothetical protein
MRWDELAAVEEAIREAQAALDGLDTHRRVEYLQAQYLDGVIDGLRRALVVTQGRTTKDDDRTAHIAGLLTPQESVVTTTAGVDSMAGFLSQTRGRLEDGHRA